MNEKKIVGILFVFFFFAGLVLGVIIINGFNNSEIDRLSNSINDGQKINGELQFTNKRLSRLNKEITERIGGLEKRIIDDNRQYQERLGGISIGLGKISEGLSGTGEDIQSIIDGLEQIKKGLREIEKVK